MVSDKQRQVLDILRSGSKTGLEVARAMWPFSLGWDKECSSVSRSSKGFIRNNNAGMSRPAKSMLTRLERMGLVRYEASTRWKMTQCQRYELTEKGKTAK